MAQCLLTDQKELSNPNRGSSIDAFYQAAVHLAKWFQRWRFLLNWPTRNKNCLWRPCLITDREEIINIHRGPSVDASNHATVHLAMRFQRRRLKCKTLIDDGRQVMAKPRISFQPGELIIIEVYLSVWCCRILLINSYVTWNTINILFGTNNTVNSFIFVVWRTWQGTTYHWSHIKESPIIISFTTRGIFYFLVKANVRGCRLP